MSEFAAADPMRLPDLMLAPLVEAALLEDLGRAGDITSNAIIPADATSALVLRALLIGAGTALVSRFDWVLYLFGAFLVVTGLRMLRMVDDEPDIANSRLLAFLRGHMRLTERLHGTAFAVRLPEPDGRLRWWFTPLALALALVESADLLFALDSVPAVLAVSTDPFVVYTSNIFAKIGRAHV